MMLASSAHRLETLLSDEVLVDRARRGQQGAFEILVSRHQRGIYRLAMRMSRNESDAEEIAQETFLHAHRGIASFHAESRFGTWIYRIAVNEALMRRRAANRRPTRSLESLHADQALRPGEAATGAQPGDPSLRADDLLDRKRLAERVRDALTRLDADSRAALVLRDLEELSAQQAAVILGVSPDAVRQRAHRARIRLRDLLYQ